MKIKYKLFGVFLFTIFLSCYAKAEDSVISVDGEIIATSNEEIYSEYPVIIFIGEKEGKISASKMACFEGEMQYIQPETDVKIITDKEKLKEFNCLKPFWNKDKSGLEGEILFAIVGSDVTTDYPDDTITFDYNKLKPMIYGREIYVKNRKVYYSDNNEMFFDYNFAGPVSKPVVATNPKAKPVTKKVVKKDTSKAKVVGVVKKEDKKKVEKTDNLGIPEYLLKSGIYSTKANDCFKDIPFPLGTVVKDSKNNSCEGGVLGTGRLSLSLPYTLKGVIDFYSGKNAMYGWEMKTDTDYDNGTITYTKDGREAVVYFRYAGDNTDMIIIVNKK